MFVFLLFSTNCEMDKNNKFCDCSNKLNPVEVANMEGVVNFNEELQEWYISVHEQNTYDVVHLFLLCDIDNSYKKANTKISFSGTTFDLSTTINAPAGSDYACIQISSISNLP